MRYYEITERAARQIETPEFRAWFRDSKVVDDNGNPLMVFHGTAADIERFQHTHNGAGSRESKLGYWFTENSGAADTFARFSRPNGAESNIVPVYLSIQNPWYPESYRDIMDLVDRHTQFERQMLMGDPPRNIRMVRDKVDHAGAIQELRSKGHDGIALLNTITDAPEGETIHQFIVFDPQQIKSVFNRGTYSQDSDHISEEKK